MSILNDRLQNASWQLKVLRGLSQIADNIVAADNDYEAAIVKETCGSGASQTIRMLLEIRVFDPSAGTFAAPVYYVPGSNSPTTIGAGCTIDYQSDAAVLALILSELESIDQRVALNVTNTGLIAGDLESTPGRTPELTRVTTNGTVASGAYSISFANVGTADAGIGGDNSGTPAVPGTILKAGETVTFSAPHKDTLDAMDYQASATGELLIAVVKP
jgi:hypothetical protein